MTQPTQDLRFLIANYDGTQNSKFPLGDKPTSIIVTGSGFGTKPSHTPAIFESFSGSSNGQLLSSYDSNWVAYADDGGVITTSNLRYAGAKSAYNDFTRGQFSTNYKQYPPTRSVFLSYWARICDFRSGYDGGVIKHGRFRLRAQRRGRVGKRGLRFEPGNHAVCGNATTWSTSRRMPIFSPMA